MLNVLTALLTFAIDFSGYASGIFRPRWSSSGIIWLRQ